MTLLTVESAHQQVRSNLLLLTLFEMSIVDVCVTRCPLLSRFERGIPVVDGSRARLSHFSNRTRPYRQ
ncbi:hypothetical protein ROP_pROB01-05110 (plasmid) [Rhodococcus opacus B4]|uniref:Uncharacterized protein n=1 Tax=Rhodococcus opacus (strain B4) TaxID=632772 RepID=C1BCF5_RHOOB|nr:hypothetical protein ROP_pROB01-05110 [Rhodococcus opacus B4]